MIRTNINIQTPEFKEHPLEEYIDETMNRLDVARQKPYNPIRNVIQKLKEEMTEE